MTTTNGGAARKDEFIHLGSTAAAAASKDLLVHERLETTQIYTHVMVKPGLGVRSPLDGNGRVGEVET